MAGNKFTQGFLGETLYHFIGGGDDNALMSTFDSIVRKGLLLTVGNRDGHLDRFAINMTGGGIESIEVMQNARVCFTDIPEDKLASHQKEYGSFGLGFSRSTILSWGGNPVFYAPNHPTPGTLETAMGSVFYCMHRVELIAAALNSLLQPGDANFTIGTTTLKGPQRDAYIDQSALSVRRALGFVKEMSHRDSNDYRYLYEREWRIVDGVTLPGGDATRALTDEEMVELGAKRPRWAQPLAITDPDILAKYPHQKMLQMFRVFNGLGGRTVAVSIERILVPTFMMKRKIQGYIRANPDLFSDPSPRVAVLARPYSVRWLLDKLT